MRNENTHPTIFDGFFPTGTVFSYTNDDVHPIIAGVETLTMSLRTIPDESKSIVFEILVKFGKRPICTLVDDFLGTCEVEGLDTSSLLEFFVSDNWNELIRRGTLPLRGRFWAQTCPLSEREQRMISVSSQMSSTMTLRRF